MKSLVNGQINEKPLLRDCCRIGVKTLDSRRPAKLTVSSADMANQIVNRDKTIRSNSKVGYKSVHISPDRTVQERKAFKQLREN